MEEETAHMPWKTGFNQCLVSESLRLQVLLNGLPHSPHKLLFVLLLLEINYAPASLDIELFAPRPDAGAPPLAAAAAPAPDPEPSCSQSSSQSSVCPAEDGRFLSGTTLDAAAVVRITQLCEAPKTRGSETNSGFSSNKSYALFAVLLYHFYSCVQSLRMFADHYRLQGKGDAKQGCIRDVVQCSVVDLRTLAPDDVQEIRNTLKGLRARLTESDCVATRLLGLLLRRPPFCHS